MKLNFIIMFAHQEFHGVDQAMRRQNLRAVNNEILLKLRAMHDVDRFFNLVQVLFEMLMQILTHRCRGDAFP